jgi:hypothetical protein
MEFKRTFDDLPSLATVVMLKVAYVLEEKIFGLVTLDNVENLMKQSATGLIYEAQLSARLREGLARETGAQDVMMGYGSLNVGVGDVAYDRAAILSEVFTITVAEYGVDLRGEDALVTEFGESHVKATEAGEEVDEPQAGLHADSFPGDVAG